MDVEILKEGLDIFESDYGDFLDEVKIRLGNGDKVKNIVTYFEKLWLFKNKVFAATLFYWLITRFCNKTEAFEVLRVYTDNNIDYKNGVVVQNAVISQRNILEHLIQTGKINITELPTVLAKKRIEDIVSGSDYKKSTKVLEQNIEILKNKLEQKPLNDKCLNDSNDIHLNQKHSDKNILGNKNKNHKFIIFNSPETIDKLWNQLKVHFTGQESELKKALEGNILDSPILFPHNQNKLVEVFRRAKYNGLIISKPKEINYWLCGNFEFIFKKGNVKENKNLNKITVNDILVKGKSEPPKWERICCEDNDWLPYKSKNTLINEKQKEQL